MESLSDLCIGSKYEEKKSHVLRLKSSQNKFLNIAHTQESTYCVKGMKVTHKHKLNNKTHISFPYTPKWRSALLNWTVFKMRKLLSISLFFMTSMKCNAKCHVHSIWVLPSHSEGRQDCCHPTKPNKFKHESGVTEGDSRIRNPFPSEQILLPASC